jgi:hypothetical protein
MFRPMSEEKSQKNMFGKCGFAIIIRAVCFWSGTG